MSIHGGLLNEILKACSPFVGTSREERRAFSANPQDEFGLSRMTGEFRSVALFLSDERAWGQVPPFLGLDIIEYVAWPRDLSPLH